MINIAMEIAKWLFNRAKQPTSAVSLAVLISFFGIDQSEELSSNIQTLLISIFGIYGILKDDKSD
jgi:hypothetical protein